MTDDSERFPDEVRSMLHRRAGDPQPSPPPLEDLLRSGSVRTLDAGAAAPPRPRWVVPSLVAAAVVVVVALVATLTFRGDGDDEVVVADDRDGGATTTTSAVSPVTDPQPRAVWPSSDEQELRRAQREFEAGRRGELGAPRTAATAYLRDRLGGDADVEVGEYLAGDADSGEVTYVLRSDDGGVDGTVLVRRAGENGMWTVLGSEHERLGIMDVTYDGERVTGAVATNRVAGELTVLIQPVDGSDPVSEEPVRLGAGRTHELSERFAGESGVVVRLTLVAEDGIVSFSEVRADAPDGAGGPGPSTCSTSELRHRFVEQDQLPPAVAAMRRKIVDAAMACDYEALDALAAADPTQAFTFSFGDPAGGPGSFWRQREAEGEPVLRRLVQTLDLRPILQRPEPDAGPGPQEQWVWPAVAGTARPSERDWDDLRPVYGDRAVDEAREMGAWYGYRAGITVRGDWIYFVAGD